MGKIVNPFVEQIIFFGVPRTKDMFLTLWSSIIVPTNKFKVTYGTQASILVITSANDFSSLLILLTSSQKLLLQTPATRTLSWDFHNPCPSDWTTFQRSFSKMVFHSTCFLYRSLTASFVGGWRKHEFYTRMCWIADWFDQLQVVSTRHEGHSMSPIASLCSFSTQMPF